MTHGQERIADIWEEGQPLVAEHQLAVGRPVELADKATYEAMDDAGLVCFTLRDEGKLVGYALFFMGALPQMPSKVQAVQDALYIKREARGHAGGKFLLWVEKQLMEMGAGRITWMVPAGSGWSWLQTMGYTPEYTAFTRTSE